MQAPKKTAIVAVYVALRYGNNILLACRANTGYQDGAWSLPAGHIEGSELPSEAIIREAYEEVGVTIQAENLELFHTSYRPRHDDTADRVDFFFRVWIWEGKPRNCEPHKCSEIRWFRDGALPGNMMPHVQHALSLQSGPFSELSVSWLKERGLWVLP
jgi:8-oxo-dGTP pyrophosphatase MutT (NUDIX family)